MISRVAFLFAALALLSGCATSYSWTREVPKDKRSVLVTTFVNGSETQELGAVMARQLAREFQREGTFSLASEENAALEIQGNVVSADMVATGYDYRGGLRKMSADAKIVVEVSVIDRRASKVLIDNQRYEVEVPTTVETDYPNALRDLSGRACDELSRLIVDDLLNLKW